MSVIPDAWGADHELGLRGGVAISESGGARLLHASVITSSNIEWN